MIVFILLFVYTFSGAIYTFVSLQIIESKVNSKGIIPNMYTLIVILTFLTLMPIVNTIFALDFFYKTLKK